ncbi:MAG: DUF3857 domain-containing protein [Acidobacteria bacterium]|nr:DUF3857 domain-containing protein [Acidobacteriota bacterium]
MSTSRRSARTALVRSAVVVSGLLLTLAAWLVAPALAAKPKARLEINPGPKKMSDEERALAPDPAIGSEHGILIVDLNEWDQNKSPKPGWQETRVTRRVRAKVFTNEGRSIADVVVPYAGSDISVISFWAFAILPDGSVKELKVGDLAFQLEMEYLGDKIGSQRGAIPGVVPGSIVEYGYDVEIRRFIPPPSFEVRKPWPIREFAYRWVPRPFPETAPAYFVGRQSGFELTPVVDQGALLITGQNIPPVLDQGYLPPSGEVNGSVWLYYTRNEFRGDKDQYWKNAGAARARGVERYTRKTSEVGEALAAMALDPALPIEKKLERAYEWVAQNLENVDKSEGGSNMYSLMIDDEDDDRRNAGQVLRARRGTSAEINLTFMAIAKALGAECEAVYVTDRSERFWDRGLQTMYQFSGVLVSVRPGGATVGTLIDPSSDLPYGGISWWFTAQEGARMTAQGAVPVPIPPGTAASNTYRVSGALRIEDAGEVMASDFTATLEGHYSRHRGRLSRMSAEDRKRWLPTECGDGGSMSVITAEATTLADRSVPLQITCETELALATPITGEGPLRVSISGPWFRRLPDWGTRPRREPLVFAFPWNESSEIEFEAPEGYVLKDLPIPTRAQSKFGSYTLLFERTEKGVLMKRSLSILANKVPLESVPDFGKMLDGVRRGDATEILFVPEAKTP